MITEVWKLIDILEKYDPYDPVRILVTQGVLEGIGEVKNIGGRIVLIPQKTLDNRVK